MMCQNIFTPLKYSNIEKIFWTELTCHMKERAWPLQKNNCRHGTPLSSKNLQEAVIRVMEDEEKKPNVT